MRNNDIRSQSLDLLRFPLAITVLAVHVFSTTGIMIGDRLCQTFLLENVQCVVNVFLRGQSVPIYYFISGYVFFLGVDLTLRKYLEKLRNRVKTLLIPFLVFNIICILLSLGVAVLCNRCLNGITFKSFISCFFAYDGSIPGVVGGLGLPVLGPTGFIRDLMVVVLCTPLLKIILEGSKGIMTIGLLSIIWMYSNLFGFNIYMPCSALFFFSLGAYMSINKMDMIIKFGKANRISLFIYSVISLILIYLYLNNHFTSKIYVGLKSLNICLGLIVLFNAAVFLLKHGYCKGNRFLSSSSFFIYITHTMICGRILKVLFVLFKPQTQLSIFFCYVTTIVITVLILIYIYAMMKKHSPRLLTLITGRK